MSTARTRSLEPSPTTTSPSTTAGASESPPQGRHRGDTITLRSRSSRRLRTTVHRRFRRHPCHFPSHSLDILELPVVTELPRTFHTATVLRRGSRLSRTGVCRDVRRTLLGRLPSGTIPSGLRFRVPTAAHHCRYHWRIRRARYFPGVLFHPPRPVTTESARSTRNSCTRSVSRYTRGEHLGASLDERPRVSDAGSLESRCCELAKHFLCGCDYSAPVLIVAPEFDPSSFARLRSETRPLKSPWNVPCPENNRRVVAGRPRPDRQSPFSAPVR